MKLGQKTRARLRKLVGAVGRAGAGGGRGSGKKHRWRCERCESETIVATKLPPRQCATPKCGGVVWRMVR